MTDTRGGTPNWTILFAKIGLILNFDMATVANFVRDVGIDIVSYDYTFILATVHANYELASLAFVRLSSNGEWSLAQFAEFCIAIVKFHL